MVDDLGAIPLLVILAIYPFLYCLEIIAQLWIFMLCSLS